jgi:hypothetical protein
MLEWSFADTSDEQRGTGKRFQSRQGLRVALCFSTKSQRSTISNSEGRVSRNSYVWSLKKSGIPTRFPQPARNFQEDISATGFFR